MEKQLNVRILNKIDTVQNWEEAANFVPMNGELIVIYNGKGFVPDFKVGDGETPIGNLPLIDNELPHANNFTWGTTVLNAGGAAPYDHNHDATYLQLVGGIMTGDIKLPKLVDANGQELILDEDTTAASRGYVAAQIADLVGGMKYLGITTTPLTDKSTTDVINIEGTNVVPQAGNVVIYDGTQYIWNTNTETPHWDLISTSSADTTYSFSGSYDDNGVWTGVLVSSTGGRTGNIAPPIFEGATQTEAGKSGMVPAPGMAQNRRYLRGDGTWSNISAQDIGALDSSTNYAGSTTPGGPATKLAHTLKFGANQYYVFDGSADLTVPVYTGSII